MYTKPEEITGRLSRQMRESIKHANENLHWLQKSVHPYFFITFGPEKDALLNLCMTLHTLGENNRLILRDTDEKYIIATLNRPGTLFQTLNTQKDKEIIYAEMLHSNTPLPGQKEELELMKFHFHTDKADQGSVPIFRGKNLIKKNLREYYRGFDFRQFDAILHCLHKKNPDYVLLSPAIRVARAMWLYQAAMREGGAFLDIEPTVDQFGKGESRLIFSAITPLREGYIAQLIEVFYRLNIATRRNYILEVDDGEQQVTILTAYITTRAGDVIDKDMPIFSSLESELYNTRVINTKTRTYSELVAAKILTGPQGSLLSAIETFVNTNLAHGSPYQYDWEETQDAFLSHILLTRELLQLFQNKFDPDSEKRMSKDVLEREYERIQSLINEYNTGHAPLDETRKIMFNVALLFVRHTLKTNFFVTHKNALSFRLDPGYMEALPRDIRGNLPLDLPFRITFFYHRHGSGYHFGFSDIARGGFRTIIARSKDDFEFTINRILKEAMVLAHTQHLKNKDIYQGGSKIAVVMRAADLKDHEAVTKRLYDFQRAVTDAFLDIFVTHNGAPADPNVVDYYGEDEPIELGPDENIDDSMIEWIAERAKGRKYLIGGGIISRKKIGINHKEYGVTSLGLLNYVQRTLKELGIDYRHEPFSVKITGGTSGDVAGNEIKLLIARCPQVRITSITDASGVVYDPEGIDKGELSGLLHKTDIDAFSPDRLHEGGFILYRREQKKEGLMNFFKKLRRAEGRAVEEWVSTDEFHREFDNIIFSHYTDIFLPCGGRPETINDENWKKLFGNNDKPTTRAIVEGANSFISPSAREKIQKQGIIVIKDSSANKCGVICSSYEVIGGLLMKDEEFLQYKEEYVADVLKILEKRAIDESELIFQRHRQSQGERLFTDISNEISYQINELTGAVYAYLIAHPETLKKAAYRKVLWLHFPDFILKQKKFKNRIKGLPFKYQAAMLSTEIAIQSIYHGGFEVPFEEKIMQFVGKLSQKESAC